MSADLSPPGSRAATALPTQPSGTEPRPAPDRADPAAHRPWITDRVLFRLGTWSGIVGSAVALPFVAAHPHLPPGDAVGVLEVVRDSGTWLLLHFGLVVVLGAIALGMAALSRSVREETAAGWSAVALVSGVIGTVVAVLGQGIDGVGLKVAADVWTASSGTTREAAVVMGAGVMGTATGVFLLVLLLYFGLTSLLYGWSFLRSPDHPVWLAATAGLGGALGVAAGTTTWFGSFSDPVYYGLFIPSAVLLLLWVGVGCAWLRLRAARSRVPAAGAATG